MAQNVAGWVGFGVLVRVYQLALQKRKQTAGELCYLISNNEHCNCDEECWAVDFTSQDKGGGLALNSSGLKRKDLNVSIGF